MSALPDISRIFHFSSPSLASHFDPGHPHFLFVCFFCCDYYNSLVTGLPTTTWVLSVLSQHGIINIFHIKSCLCSKTSQCLFMVKTSGFRLAYPALHHLFIHLPSLRPQLLQHTPLSAPAALAHLLFLEQSGLLPLEGICTCYLGCSSPT